MYKDKAIQTWEVIDKSTGSEANIRVTDRCCQRKSYIAIPIEELVGNSRKMPGETEKEQISNIISYQVCSYFTRAILDKI